MSFVRTGPNSWYWQSILSPRLLLVPFILLMPCSINGQTQRNAASGSNSLVATLDGAGALEQSDCLVFAIDTIEIPARDVGFLAEVRVSQGMEVVKGDLLARLDSSAAELELQLTQLNAQIAAREAGDDSDIQLANSIVEEAKIILENFQTLRLRNSATESELRQRQIAVTQAEVKLTHAKQGAEQLKLRAQVAQSSILAAEEKLKRLKMIAPIDGTITEVLKKEGEWVQAGQPICKLVRLNELRVDFFVLRDTVEPSSLVGTRVHVFAKSSDGTWAEFVGSITSFDPEVTSQGKVRIHATVQNQRLGRTWRLLPGMTVRLRTQPIAAVTDKAARNDNRVSGVR